MRRLLFKLSFSLALIWQYGIAFALEKEIIFPGGSQSASVQATAVDGYTHNYSFHAKAGQTLTATITSSEKNAVLHIFLPGYTARRIAGTEDVKGTNLPHAGVGDEATNWNGVLPTAGKYLIVVGSTRGNTNYKLTVSVK